MFPAISMGPKDHCLALMTGWVDRLGHSFSLLNLMEIDCKFFLGSFSSKMPLEN